MPIIGAAELDVQISVNQAVSTLEVLRVSVDKTFSEIREKINKSFKLDSSLVGLKTVTDTLAGLDNLIGTIERRTKGLDLSAPYKEALEAVRQLREETEAISGIGTLAPQLSRSQSEQTRTTFFLQETQAAHEAALAREKAFLEEEAAAAKSVNEQRALRESLFLLETQVAHDAAVEKEKQYLAEAAAAKQAVAEEKALQQALFVQQTQGAHEVALAKERAYEQEVAAATAATKAQEKLAAELAASINRINPGLAKDRQQEFDALVARASGVTEASGKLSGAFDHLAQRGGLVGNVAGKLGGIFGKAEGALKGFGFSISDVSVLLGTGFAGGVAGVVLIAIEFIKKIGEMIKALFDFAKAAAQIASQLESLRANLTSTFGDSAKLVEEFSDVTALAFGISKAAALDYANTIGQLLTQFGVTEDRAAQLSIAMFKVAEGLRRGHEANVTFEKSLKDVQDVLAGNIEAVKELGLRIEEQDLKKVADDLRAIGITVVAPFDSAEKALLASLILIEEAKERLKETAEAPRTLNEVFETTKAVLGDIVADIGVAALPAFRFLADLVLVLVLGVKRLVEGFALFFAFLSSIVKSVKNAAERFKPLQIVLDGLKATLTAMFPGLVLLLKVLGRAPDIADAAREASSAYADELANLDVANQNVLDSLRDLNTEHGATIENLEQVADAHIRLTRAIQDGELAVAEAEENLRRTREDAGRKAVEVQRQNQRSLEDANRRIQDANIKLERAREDQIRKVEDVEFDHNRKIQDLRRNHQRKLEDFAEQEKKQRDQSTFDLVSSFRAIEDAQREDDVVAERAARRRFEEAKSGKDLHDLQIDQTRELEDFRREMDEAREDRLHKLNDIEIESNRQIFDAQRDLQKAFEDRQRAFEDAMQRLSDLEIENKRRLADAQDRLEDAERRAQRAILDAGTALDRLNEKFGTMDLTLAQILDKIERLKNGIEDLPRDPADPARLAVSSGTIAINAAGTRNFRGGWSLVGEEGRELVRLPRGSDIFSNAESERMLAGGETTVNVFHADRDEDEMFFAIAQRLAASQR